MAADMPSVTDVTDVTEILYPPYTCTCARKNTSGKRVTSVTSVTGGQRVAAEFGL